MATKQVAKHHEFFVLPPELDLPGPVFGNDDLMSSYKVIIKFVHDSSGNSLLKIPNVISTWKETKDVRLLVESIHRDTRVSKMLLDDWGLQVPVDVVQIAGITRVKPHKIARTVVKPIVAVDHRLSTIPAEWEVEPHQELTSAPSAASPNPDPQVIEVMMENRKVEKALYMARDT